MSSSVGSSISALQNAAPVTVPAHATPPSPAKSDSSGLSDASRAVGLPVSNSNAASSHRASPAAPNGTSRAAPNISSNLVANRSVTAQSSAGPSSVASSSKDVSTAASPDEDDESMDTDSDVGSNAAIATAASAAAHSKAQRQSRGFDEAEANPDLYGLRRSVRVAHSVMLLWYISRRRFANSISFVFVASSLQGRAPKKSVSVFMGPRRGEPKIRGVRREGVRHHAPRPSTRFHFRDGAAVGLTGDS